MELQYVEQFLHKYANKQTRKKTVVTKKKGINVHIFVAVCSVYRVPQSINAAHYFLLTFCIITKFTDVKRYQKCVMLLG